MPRERLARSSVVEAAAALLDEVGFDRLTMGLLAERLQVKAPSLYKHVSGQADLTGRIAVLAATELGDALRDATQGVARGDALAAAARALRTYVREHPGRYAAASRPTGPADPQHSARVRLFTSFAAVLSGYRLDPRQEVHALRMVRGVLSAFASAEAAGEFQLDVDVDESFAWMITFIDNGLRAAGRSSERVAAVGGQARAGDVAGVLPGEERDQAGDLLR
ncbi:WHG domain-containing protein [Lentzea sp. NPDC058436]|uniref:TetR/AcrR family transcriptional regulator n=1 Tax=Lentzea sp. NPDC058436 TaxID=3346499 RepID=UPI0036529F6B